MNDLLYINDTLVDLDTKESIAQTVKAWDIGDIKSRFANYTNKIKVPKTPGNRINFGFPEDEKSTTTTPYIKLPAKLIQNGVETIPNGLALITEAEDVYVIEVYSGVFSFFDGVSEKTLQDLDLKAYDTAGTNPQIIFPFIDYGNMDETDDPIIYQGFEYPSFPYKTLVEEIIKQNSYEKSGNVFNDARLAAMHLSALGFGGYGEQFTKPKEFFARRDTSVVFNATAVFTKVNFTEVESDADGWYDGTNTYTVQDPQGGAFGGSWFLFEGYAYADVNVALAGGASGVELEIFTPTSGPYQIVLGNGNNKVNLEISARTNGTQPGLTGPISGIDGNQFYMRARTVLGVGTATLTFNEASLWNKVLRERVSTYTDARGVMPTIKQRDLLQDFFMHYGIIATEKKLPIKTVAALSTFQTSGGAGTAWTPGVTPSNTIGAFGVTENLFGVLRASGNCIFSYDIDATEVGQLNINLLDAGMGMIQQFGPYSLAIGNNIGQAELNVLPTARFIAIQINNASGSSSDIDVNAFTLLNKITSSTTTLVLKTIKEIINDKANAVDWTSKRVKEEPNTKYKFRNYAQSNYLSYADPDDIGSEFGRGILPIPNQNIPNELNLFQSELGISDTRKLGNETAGYITAARIPVWEDGEERNDPGPRITMVRNRRDPEPSISGPGTGYKVGYTIDPLAPIDLDWQDFVNEEYHELRASLIKAKFRTHYYNLTEEDIQTIDVHKLIYDNGSYYLLNSVINYVPDIETKVELFKVA